MKKLIVRTLKPLTLVDYLGIGVITVLSLALFFFFLRKTVLVDIRVKVTNQDVLYAYTNPGFLYADRFFVGDVERDALGRVTAKIKKVRKYNQEKSSKVVYLDLLVRAAYDKKAGLYYVKGKPLIFGSPIRFNFSTVIFDGLVTELPEPYRKSFYETSEYTVVVLIKGVTTSVNSEGVLISGTVEPEVIQSRKRGDKITDSDSQSLVEVLENTITPSTHLITNGRGQAVSVNDPKYVDGLITLKVQAKVAGDEVYVLDDISLKINQTLPLIFNHVSIYPTILSFEKL